MHPLKKAPIMLSLALLAAGAHAQGPGGGGFQPSPQMMAKFKAWQTWRNNHKNITALQQTLSGFQEMEQDPRTQLNKSQARTVLAVLGKWRSKPVMTDAQARQVNQQITAPLNVAQIKKIVTASAGRRGGGFGGGGGRPGGQPGGPNPAAFPDPKDYNPLNPNTMPFARARPRMAQRLSDLMTALKRAK